MSILAGTRKLLGSMSAGLSSQDCLLCAAPAEPALLCRACGSALPRLQPPLCLRCALPVDGEICGACLKQAPCFDATLAALRYEFPVDRLVQQLKYRHVLALAPWCASLLLSGPRPCGDIMVPLPLAPGRLRERGFNQAQEIARSLARALEIPLVSDACQRPRDGVAQALLPWQERRKNVRDAFECTIDLAGKAVIVVDDVMTTGATLNEFAHTLKKHGASSVTNWVVARALKH